MNAKAPDTTGWTIDQWRAAYEAGVTPAQLLTALTAGAAAQADVAWIHRCSDNELASQLEQLAVRLAAAGGARSALPLYGVPFAVKDNIDMGGWPTTAACPQFSYVAAQDATVVARLRAAGAILVGKTNLDQFATGLVGTRSPYGAVPNSFDPAYVSGGSSAGSASVVARGLVPFSLGTDTAGSGRVPAGFNNIVGLKPTKGWLSTAGVVPACRTQDCVSVFALTVDDAQRVAGIAGGYDPGDAYSRPMARGTPMTWPDSPRLAVPARLEFYGDDLAAQAFDKSLARLQGMGVRLERIDFSAFVELANLLYQGPWVAERYAAVQALWERDPDAIHPVVRGIVEQAANYTAVDAFKAEYRRAELARTIQEALAEFDGLVVPTSPSIYTTAQMLADPVTLNTRFGYYTNFANLADLSALALPADMRTDGLPAGITLIGPAWHDRALANFGRRWQHATGLPLGATGRPLPADVPSVAPAAASAAPAPAAANGQMIRVAVVGAHLTGMPLNHQLTSRHAVLVQKTLTAPCYRLYALANTSPPKPGLVRVDQGGASIVVEVWDVPAAGFGGFVAEVPGPLGIGTLALADGTQVKGFICEPIGLQGARDITGFGGWRSYLDHLSANAKPAGARA